ncbi:MAG: hypothetical protein JWN03_5842 [Nocardia sp.]|uniref:hypothetical protein n=1 Tax=Nocardia sp. TaxID=1821 RepID=UPI0026198DD1|nr:hypothetical protein [Nocardia sp.]MCU1645567.1 hypothetical protein [Nocardia sp.]
MAQPLTVALGIAALTSAAVAVLAPQAAAKDLASGVSCSDYTCRNDTDDIYYVTGQVTCSIGGGAHDFSAYVGRRATEQVPISCPSNYQPGTSHSESTMQPDGTWQNNQVQDPGTWDSTYPLTIDYRTATVDNDQKLGPRTGSAG